MKIVFFSTPSLLRRWFGLHHASAAELWVGYYKKDSGRKSITWPESVDEALCVGWIDGIRKSVDETSYTIRFTPRKARSIWSSINIRRAGALEAEGRLKSTGRKAFEARLENRSGVYSYEQRPEDLNEPYRGFLRRNKAAHAFFAAQPASYRRAACWWVISAKGEETRLGRLRRLIGHSVEGQRIPQFTRREPARLRPAGVRPRG